MSSKNWKKQDQEAHEAEEQNTPSQTEEMESTVAFNDWFSVRLQGHKKLRAHHHPVILTYFKKQNLSENETASKYDQALAKFGF